MQTPRSGSLPWCRWCSRYHHSASSCPMSRARTHTQSRERCSRTTPSRSDSSRLRTERPRLSRSQGPPGSQPEKRVDESEIAFPNCASHSNARLPSRRDFCSHVLPSITITDMGPAPAIHGPRTRNSTVKHQNSLTIQLPELTWASALPSQALNDDTTFLLQRRLRDGQPSRRRDGPRYITRISTRLFCQRPGFLDSLLIG